MRAASVAKGVLNAVPGYEASALATQSALAGNWVTAGIATVVAGVDILSGGAVSTASRGVRVARQLLDPVTLYHGTSSSRASRILDKGFRPGRDGNVFFAEEFNTASHFAREGSVSSSTTVMRFTMERNLADELGLLDRALLGEARGLRWIDISGGSGFERILSGNSIGLFNESLRNGAIAVDRIRLR